MLVGWRGIGLPGPGGAKAARAAPDAAWAIGRAIDWVLNHPKEKTPKDPTIREKFNSYRFADHKEAVVELLKRVTTVSVRTMEIVEAMRALKR